MPKFSISAAATADWPRACERLFSHHPPREGHRQELRLIELLKNREFEPDGLLVADSGSQLVGVVLVQTQPGATGLVWPVNADSTLIEDALTHAGLRWLQDRGVKQAQMLLPPRLEQRAEAWLRCGFRRVTRLQSLHRPVRLPVGQSPSRLRWSDADDCLDEYMEVWLASHLGTLDCPELNGVRTPAEVIAGNLGLRGNAAWFLAQLDGSAVGLLNLVHGEAGIVELDYLGLRPEARGRGLGRELLHRAIRQAQAWNADWLRLSVDVRNLPALRLYEREGFQWLDELVVYLWSHQPEA